jgi:hypothetical protein
VAAAFFAAAAWSEAAFFAASAAGDECFTTGAAAGAVAAIGVTPACCVGIEAGAAPAGE